MKGSIEQMEEEHLADAPRWIKRLADQLQQHRRHRHAGGGAMSYGRHCGPAPSDAKLASVLVLIYPSDGNWIVPLTLRQPHLSVHAGQVSLPGGSLESGESSWQAALRETQEELGLEPNLSKRLGPLTPLYVFNSNFLVFPWVAYAEQRPLFRPNELEVAHVVELPVHPAPRPNPARRMTIHRGRLQFTAPYWECGTQRIWGATYIILSELAALLGCLEQDGAV